MQYDNLDVHKTFIPNSVLDALKNIIMRPGYKQPPQIQDFVDLGTKAFLDAYERSIGVDRPLSYPSWVDWSRTEPSRGGSDYKERVRFWASQKSNMPSCPFIYNRQIVLPIYFSGEYEMVVFSVHASSYGEIWTVDIREAIPLFDRLFYSRIMKALPLTASERNRLRNQVDNLMNFMGSWENVRKAFVREAKNGRTDNGKRTMLVPSGRAAGGHIKGRNITMHEAEAVSELDDHVADAMSNLNGEMYVTTSKTQAFNAAIDAAKIKTEESNDTMSKSKAIAANMIEANKKAGKDIAFLNAGRASNKIIKTAMTPILRVLMKPTFIQRAFMKLTGAQDPVEKFMESPISDLVAAEGFKLALEIKGVKDARLQETADKAIVYAGMKVTDQFPLEDLMDEAISKVANAVTESSALDKVLGKDK